jgi:hypothetical protein
MANSNATDALLNDLSNLPIHPTGSGAADLETAYEQMRLAEDAEDSDSLLSPSSASEITAHNSADLPAESADVEESAAHPS